MVVLPAIDPNHNDSRPLTTLGAAFANWGTLDAPFSAAPPNRPIPKLASPVRGLLRTPSYAPYTTPNPASRTPRCAGIGSVAAHNLA